MTLPLKKRIFTLFFLISLCFTWEITLFASETPSSGKPTDRKAERVIDMAYLLSDTERTTLLEKLNEISERQQFDVIAATVNGLEGMEARDYAAELYEYLNFGYGDNYDGIIFLVSMEERDWVITASGRGREIFDDAEREYIAGKVLPDLSSGNYARAFTAFADLCDDFISQPRTGTYNSSSLSKRSSYPLSLLTVPLVGGFLISLLVVTVMKSQLKSVRFQSSAGNYVKNGSMRVTKSNDLFLYRHVDRRKKPEPPKTHSSPGSRSSSSSHRSSSGRSYSSTSGKF